MKDYKTRGRDPITKETVLDHPVRKQIIEIMNECPGITLMEIAGSLDMDTQGVRYHIDVLKDFFPIDSRPVEKAVHYDFNLNHKTKIVAKKFWAILDPDGNVMCETISDNRTETIELFIETQSKSWKTKKRDGYKCHRVLIVPVDIIIGDS